MAYCSESAAKLFLRNEDALSHFPLENNLFPHFTSQDIVEISGEAGSGKTELLYHFVAQCIFPCSWKDLNLGGLEVQVTFIDNDCHFDLFRLVTILEQRVKSYAKSSDVTVGKEEYFLFIQNILKRLYIVKCYSSEEFILTLNSLETTLGLQSTKNILMIDGISSFYWLDKARVQNSFPKLALHYKVMSDLIIKISKNCRTPIIATRRKLLSLADNDKKIFGQTWNNAVSWRFKLEFKSSLADKTLITLTNSSNSSAKLCAIKKSGFVILN